MEQDVELRVEQLDDGATGIEVEKEDDASTSEDLLRQPFDPTLIRVRSRPMVISLLLSRIDDKALDLSPSFQRQAGIWSDETQSRLIESLLIRIPIPAFYIDATDDDHWLVVDGLQRLTALRRFVLDKELKLRGLEFLGKDLHGKTFEQLSSRFQRRIMETEVIVYAIESGTPDEVKFNIFKRINTGGLPLSPQEIRHALNQGPSTELLKKLAESSEFQTVTGRGISDKRMADRECVLRFLTFMETPYIEYRVADFDGFLNKAMAHLNQLAKTNPTRFAELQTRFSKTMVVARQIFGDEAFRKRYHSDHKRTPINKALFETWSVNLAQLTPEQLKVLVEKRQLVMEKFIALMNDRDFDRAVSQGTGDPAKLRLRFEQIARLIKEVLR